jgi:predicted alpha/beta-fold hydrolase
LASDGATITFDVFSPSTYSSKKTKGCPIVAVIPGIGNGSDRPYVQVLVNELNQFGYTVVVLNHLGAVANEKLTSRRIFTYGGTDDLQLMIDWVLEEWPGRPIIGIGLSMGGNVLMKYLGEKPDRQSHFIGAATVCQGYNLMKAYPTWMSWQGLRRLYNFHITRNVLTVVRRHRDVLFSPLIHQRDDSSCDDGVLASQPNMKETLSATSLSEVDTHLQRYLAKFDTLEEYYDQHSCCHHLHKIANIPVLLLNTLDDPLVPEILLESARDYASEACLN